MKKEKQKNESITGEITNHLSKIVRKTTDSKREGTLNLHCSRAGAK